MDSIVTYVQGRGAVTMEEAIHDAPPRFRQMACSQDTIGWRWFLEGMLSTEITQIQQQYMAVNGLQMNFGHVVLRFDHAADGDHTRAMALTELCGPRSGVWNDRNGKERGVIAGN